MNARLPADLHRSSGLVLKKYLIAGSPVLNIVAVSLVLEGENLIDLNPVLRFNMDGF